MKMKKIITILIGLLVIASVTAYVIKTPRLYQIAKRHRNSENIDLCDKDEVEWECITGRHAPDGSIRYSVIGDKLYVEVRAFNLEGTGFQLTLNGAGDTVADDLLASACPDPNGADPWVCGYWGNQGFYNFEMNENRLRIRRRSVSYKNEDGFWVYDQRDMARFRHRYEVTLPEGIYEGVKFIVKDATTFDAVLMETHPMNFVIVNDE